MTTAFPTQFLYPYTAQPTSLVQSVGAATSVSGPASFTQNVTATKAGNLLVWAVAVNASAGAALGATPSGWTLSTTQAVATLALGIYTYPNNPGGITSVVLASPTATTGGIAGWFWEISGALTGTGALELTRSANGSSTSPSPGANYTPTYTNELVLGIDGWVISAGAPTITAGTVPAAGFTNNTTQSSSAGTTNASIQTSSSLGFWQSTAVNMAGTLSGSAVWASALVVVQVALSQKALLSNISGIGGNLSGDLGSYATGG